jgi:hypothetical protein
MRSRPFVRVVGVALLVSACEKQPEQPPGNPPFPEPTPPTGNPPAPEPTPDGTASTGNIPEVGGATGAPVPGHEGPAPAPPPNEPTHNPPAPLPTWESVGSGHPEGATNPPSPVLVVTREPLGCYKAWEGGMRPPAPEVMRTGGRVVDTPASVGRATQVQCPPGQPDELLAKWAEAYPSTPSPKK